MFDSEGASACKAASLRLSIACDILGSREGAIYFRHLVVGPRNHAFRMVVNR
jgi:hypothetical protein